MRQRSKAELIAEIKYAKANKDTTVGLKLAQMIALLILQDGYGWEASEIKVFYEMYAKYLEAYQKGEISQEDIKAQVEQIKSDIGIDILAPVIIGDECEKRNI